MYAQLEDLLTDQAQKIFRGQPKNRILEAAVGVLKGVTDRIAEQLWQLDNIETVGDLLKQADYSNGGLQGRIPPAERALTPDQLESLISAKLLPKHDPGPPRHWERLFERAPLDPYSGPAFYRGRLDGTARVLVIAQKPVNDDAPAYRALVNDDGQRLQGLLEKIGITRSYLILNTTFSGGVDAVNEKSDTDPVVQQYRNKLAVQQYRNQLFDQAKASNDLEAVFVFGRSAQESLRAWPGLGALRVVSFLHPSYQDDAVLAANWNLHLDEAHKAVKADRGAVIDLSPYQNVVDVAAIPRSDLPFGAPAWEGSQTPGFRQQRTRRVTPITTVKRETTTRESAGPHGWGREARSQYR